MNLFTLMYAARAGGTYLLLALLLLLYMIFIVSKQGSIYKIPRSLQKYLIYDTLPEGEVIRPDALKFKIAGLNQRREVRNWDKYGVVGKETTVLAVQAQRDIRGLQHLIVSLAQVRHIDSVLLLFSHSYYSEHINELIRSIDFCKVLQIFFPHSIQLHPDKFPGIDPDDCVNGSTAEDFKNCQHRDARLTERKHHWWWKAHFVFDHMEWSSGYTGTVIFLEEDQYVSPDLLYMLQYVQRSLIYFPDVEIMSFGRMYARNLDTDLLTLEYWRPPFDVGLAFNKTTWRKIVDLSSFYCMYDDCSWSYSLLNLFQNLPKGNIDMMACVFPRVIATRQFESLEQAAVELNRAFSKSRLFPDNVKAVSLFGPDGRVQRSVKAAPRGNGGWGDLRDHILCLDPWANTTEDYSYDISSSTFSPLGTIVR